MCGIFGIFGSVNKELVNAMSEALKHRDPDDSGFFFGDNVALGNARLSIIDVKGGAHTHRQEPLNNRLQTKNIVKRKANAEH